MNKFRLYKASWISKESPHLQQKISKLEANKMLAKGGCFIRNTYDFDCGKVTTFWYVIKDVFGDIDELPTKVRNQVRKAQKIYEIKQVTAEYMIENCFELYNLSRSRFGGETIITKEQWHKQVFCVEQDYWVAIERETNVPQAFALNKLHNDYCDYISMGVNPRAPKSTYPMYGLIFEMNRYYLENLELKYVLDGSRSVTEHSNIQPFLEEKFKFRKAYCDLQIFYKPMLGIAVKLLFPFRKLIKHPKISAILRQEAWARGLEK